MVLAPRHGYGIAKTIRSNSSAALDIEFGSLYPALKRLELKGWVAAKWEISEHKEAESKAASRAKERFFHDLDSTLADLAKTIVQYLAEVKKPDGQRLSGYHEAQLDSLRFQLSSPARFTKR